MTKQKKVLVLTSTYPRWNGDSTPSFIADFVKHIALRLSDVYVLTPHYDHAKTHEVNGNIHIKRIHYFTSRRETIFYGGGAATKISKTPVYALKLLGYTISLFCNTLFIALRQDVDVINAHWIVPQGFIAILVKFLIGKPVAVTVHGTDILGLNGRYMQKIKRFVLKNADIVYVNSSVTEEACENIYKRPYRLIPMGVDLHMFQSASASKKIRESFRLGKFTVIFVGRLTPTKGIIYLLEAVKQLKGSGRTVKAIIIGAGPLDKELETYVKSNDLEEEVVFPGWIDHSQLPQYYKTADIFVGPSLQEAQGLVFVEALAAGLPVITTNIGGARDFIRDGINGYLINPKTSQQIYEKLALLYDNPNLLENFKKHSLSSIANTYTWSKVADSYLESWKDLV